MNLPFVIRKVKKNGQTSLWYADNYSSKPAALLGPTDVVWQLCECGCGWVRSALSLGAQCAQACMYCRRATA